MLSLSPLVGGGAALRRHGGSNNNPLVHCRLPLSLLPPFLPPLDEHLIEMPEFLQEMPDEVTMTYENGIVRQH